MSVVKRQGPEPVIAFFRSDALICFLAVMLIAGGMLLRILHSGSIESGFVEDVHLAQALARRYLAHPPDLEVMDMYTQGFIHPLLYVPLITGMRHLEVPPALQDGLAAALVQVLAVGALAALAYLGCRATLRRGAALMVTFVCIVPPLLMLPIDAVQTQVSPNAEILGSVLLLALWVCTRFSALRRGLSFACAVILVVACFHLKYQLMPQALVIVMISAQPLSRRLRCIGWGLLACLAVDVLVYRLNGDGFFGRVSSLFGNYIGIGRQEVPRSGGLRDLAVAVVVSGFVFVNNFPRFLASVFGFVATVFQQAPQFVLVWLCWLWLLVAGKSLSAQALVRCRSSLVLSVATLFAIALPGKNFAHYYLLLIPTSIIVLTSLLESEARLFLPKSRIGNLPHGFALSIRALIGWTLASACLLLLLFWQAEIAISRYVRAHDSNAGFLLPGDVRKHGVHVYGWNNRLFGLEDTYPSGLDLGYILTKAILNEGPSLYVAALRDPGMRPRFILDQMASSKHQSFMGKLGYKSLEVMAARSDVPLSSYYRKRQENDLGVLYERLP